MKRPLSIKWLLFDTCSNTLVERSMTSKYFRSVSIIRYMSQLNVNWGGRDFAVIMCQYLSKPLQHFLFPSEGSKMTDQL